MPLFPLGTVLYPGLVLPLHIFEARHRPALLPLQPELTSGGRGRSSWCGNHGILLLWLAQP